MFEDYGAREGEVVKTRKNRASGKLQARVKFDEEGWVEWIDFDDADTKLL